PQDASSPPIASGEALGATPPLQPGVELPVELHNPVGTSGKASTWPWVVGAWMLGGLCLLALEGTRLVRLRRRIRTNPPDPAIVARVETLSAHLGIRVVP